MLSRRRFLSSSTAVAGIAGISNLARGDEGSRDCKPLPPALANLKSLKGEAKPITTQERIERQERARQLMRANTMDAILLAPGTSLRYLTGIQWWGGERLFAMVMPVKGKPFLVCPAFEQGRAEEQIANSPQAGAEI